MISDQLREIPVVGALADRFGDAITGAAMHVNQLAVDVEPSSIVEVCRCLKYDKGYTRLSGITGVDWYPLEPRFQVVYLLHSMQRRADRLRLNSRVPGADPEVDSVTPVWQGANWYEREVFDLFGVRFRNHPSLTRIMMPEHWEGHPLRKDFPVYGYKYTYKDE